MAMHGPTWEPKAADYLQIFEEQSPWRRTGAVPAIMARPVERPMAKCLWERLIRNEPQRFQLLLGPRRVGKTTVLYQTVARLLRNGVPTGRVWWLRLDHPLLMRIPVDNLIRHILEGSEATADDPMYVFLDEITYARDWDLWLKTFYDEKWPIRLAGSSSATAALRERRMESGVGRWEEQYLTPYLFTEFLELNGKPGVVPLGESLCETLYRCAGVHQVLDEIGALRRRFILTGGFPELLIPDHHRDDEQSVLLQSQRTLRSDAVERAIYKDIPQAFGVDDPLLLERLLYTLAGQFTGVLSPTTLCQTLGGMSQPTFDKYLSYLEMAFLVFTLPNYSGNEASKQRRGRKLYFIDGAVRNAALQRGIGPLSDLGEMGLLLENAVAGHLHALSQQTQVRLYHWRDKDVEVDLIYDHPEQPVALEIASGAGHPRDGLHALIDRFPRFKNRCFIAAPHGPATHPVNNGDGVGTLPLDLLLMAIGAQAERELSIRITPGGPIGCSGTGRIPGTKIR